MNLASIDSNLLALIANVIFQFATLIYLWSTMKMLRDLCKLTGFNSEVLNSIRNDVAYLTAQIEGLKESLSFLEASALYTMPLEPTQINLRSKAARDMWKRRKQKQVEKKS